MNDTEIKKKVNDLNEIFTLVKAMREGESVDELPNSKWLLATNEHRSVDLWCKTFLLTHMVTLSLVRNNHSLSLDVWKNFGLDMVESLRNYGEHSPLFKRSEEEKKLHWSCFITQVLSSLKNVSHSLLIDDLLYHCAVFCNNLCGFKTPMLPDDIERFVKMHEQEGDVKSHYEHYKAPGQPPFNGGGYNPNYANGGSGYNPPNFGPGFNFHPPFYNPNTRFDPNVGSPHHGDYTAMVQTIQFLQDSVRKLEDDVTTLKEKMNK